MKKKKNYFFDFINKDLIFEKNNQNFKFKINYKDFLITDLNYYNEQLSINLNLSFSKQIEQLKIKPEIKSETKTEIENYISMYISIISSFSSIMQTQLYNVISEFVNNIQHFFSKKNIEEKLNKEKMFSHWNFLLEIRNTINHFESIDTSNEFFSKKIKDLKKIWQELPTDTNSFKLKLSEIEFSKEKDFWEIILKIHLELFEKIYFIIK